MITPYRKKLIEVALPLEAINREAAREKSIRHGHPSTLHLWWARRPLAACRAVIFASLVDDPSSRPDLYPTLETQEKKRQDLFRLIEELVKWENSNNEEILNRARKEILDSTDGNPPPVYDPFCGGGSIPLEAQRLGLEAHASDLNPIPVLINKALIEIPPKFAGCPPINPDSREKLGDSGSWKGISGLAEDIRYYGKWMRDEAEKRIGHLYPKVKAVREGDGSYRHARLDEIENPNSNVENLTVIAWLWARTVASPNPAAKGVPVPLTRSFWLSTKTGRKAWVEPIVDAARMTYQFEVRTGSGEPPSGTVNRNGAFCVLTGSPIPLESIRVEGKAGRLGTRLMAIVAEGRGGRCYLSPTDEHEHIAASAEPQNVPDTDLPMQALGFRVQNYGMTKHRQLFTNRQLAALTTFSDLVSEAREKLLEDSAEQSYTDAVTTYLGLCASKAAVFYTTLARWRAGEGKSAPAFGRQAVSMVWDFTEVNPFAGAGGDFSGIVDGACRTAIGLPAAPPASCTQLDAARLSASRTSTVFSTDPPYYDNVPYADLSDYFYVWVRRSLQKIYPDLLGTVLVPKMEELVAEPFRHGSRDAARSFFEQGMARVFAQMRDASDPRFPTTIYYAFKQAEDEDEESESDDGATTPSAPRASTGWETFLQGLIDAGWQIDGTWPIRTEGATRMRGMGSNALASSIVLVCRPRPENAGIASRRDFLAALRRELPEALRHLQKGNIAPVDLAQAAIGPGMAVFSRYSRVMENDGTAMGVWTALALINGTLDEVLAEQEGEFDAETRWALAWFDQYGFSDGPYGVAETLCTAKNTAVSAMEQSGILTAKAGKVRLLRADELAPEWDPKTDARFTIWEATHYLVRVLEARGEDGSADLIARLGGARAELARDLSYRLYTICERRKWAKDALQYNALVQAWPEASRLATTKPIVEKLTQKEML